MSTPENGAGNAGQSQALAELLALWQRWNSHDVTDRAARRAEAAGDLEQAEKLRALYQHAPSAMTALAAEHELTSLLAGWRWHTVLAAREQGATWAEIADATSTPGTGDAEAARGEFLAQLERAHNAEARFDIPFRDAERYRAAAEPDDVSDDAPEAAAMSTDQPAAASQTEARPLVTPGTEEPGLALEDAWFRGALERSVPLDAPDRASVIEDAIQVARERFVTDGTITYPEQALDLLARRDQADTPPALQSLTAAELLVRAERADNRTYLASSYGELDEALREVEALEGEAWNRAEASGDDNDRALAEYLGLLMNEPDVERFDEYTELHNTVHRALGVQATPPEDDAGHAAAADEPVEAPVGGPAWVQGTDAATWTPERAPSDGAGSIEQSDDGLVVGTIVLPGGLPPDEDDHGGARDLEDDYSGVGAAAVSTAGEATARRAARARDAADIAGRVAGVRAQVAVRDAALAAEDVPAPRTHAEDLAHSPAAERLDVDEDADGAWDR